MSPPRKYTDEERKARRREASARWHARNPEYKIGWQREHGDRQSLANKKLYYGKSEAKRQDARLRRRYGITLVDKESMLLRQGGCGICGSANPRSKKGWHVDHCHLSGVVRGVLCSRCNHLLGVAKDNAKTLTSAARYLLDSPAPPE